MKAIIKEKGSVYCGNDAWLKLDEFLLQKTPTNIYVISDEHTRTYCANMLLSKVKLSTAPIFLTIPAGEENKTINTCLTLWNLLSEKGADRSSLIINLGGGMITDLGGFVASTFKRGLSFVNIPTSLLAMVDASIGGKNGVDLGVIKNQIGVINNPDLVIIDTTFLNTLPENELNSGYAEMLKHGLIYTEAYWESLKEFDIKNKEATENAIWESVVFKNKIVSLDPTEQKERKTLNYGHTLGHAIESYCLDHPRQNRLLHGEAIAIGMILAGYISSVLLHYPIEIRDSTTTTILKFFPKTAFTSTDIDNIIELLKFDKKNKNGKILFVLLKSFGNYKTDCIVGNTLIKEAFEFYRKF